MQNDSDEIPKESSSKPPKSTLKILEEVDKEMIHDVPPNFSDYNFTRIHENEEGKLRD